MTDPSPALRIRGLWAGYASHVVLDDFSLEVARGQWVMILGPNGAGKSTLLKVLLGPLKALRGDIEVLGQPLKTQRRAGRLAYLPQQEDIDWDFPIAVRDAVMTGRFGRLRQDPWWRRLLAPRWGSAPHWQVVDQSLAAVDMSALAQRSIGALSGGQKKRVMLARALAQQADVLLLDEPLSGVDARSGALILKVLAEERSAGRTVIMVSHDVASAREHADQVLLFNRGVIAYGPPDAVLTDDNLMRTAAPEWASGDG